MYISTVLYSVFSSIDIFYIWWFFQLDSIGSIAGFGPNSLLISTAIGCGKAPLGFPAVLQNVFLRFFKCIPLILLLAFPIKRQLVAECWTAKGSLEISSRIAKCISQIFSNAFLWFCYLHFHLNGNWLRSVGQRKAPLGFPTARDFPQLCTARCISQIFPYWFPSMWNMYSSHFVVLLFI